MNIYVYTCIFTIHALTPESGRFLQRISRGDVIGNVLHSLKGD